MVLIGPTIQIHIKMEYKGNMDNFKIYIVCGQIYKTGTKY